MADERARWTIVPSPDQPSSFRNELLGVTALSPSNAWAVGYYDKTMAIGSINALVEHWNGSKWTVVAVPQPPGTTASFLQGITKAGSTDVFAVGSYTVSNVEKSLTELWNGASWSIIANALERHELEGLRLAASTR
jgi:hypothetical protein